MLLTQVRDVGEIYRGDTRILFLLSHGLALLIAAPKRSWPLVDAAVLVAWGGANLLVAAATLSGGLAIGDPIPRLLLRAVLSTAVGIEIVRSEPIARVWAWPLLRILQPGVNAIGGNLLLLGVAVGVTRYIRHRPEFLRSTK